METLLPYLGTGGQIMSRFGAPSIYGGITFAPYDLIGDTLRCTMGIMKDLYRCPEKILAATEALTPMAIEVAVSAAYASRTPHVIIPLHKGADGFMSPEQFKKFYWPSFKAMLLGIIEAGVVPIPFVEGSFNQRLDIMAEDPLPKGTTAWLFDRTNMKAAKEKIGDWACIGGNVPASLFKQGSVEELEAYCKDLIETCGPGGGLFLSPGAVVDQGNVENMRAYLNSGSKFGKY
jgi:uroporphyrinogen-III decarboxylase